MLTQGLIQQYEDVLARLMLQAVDKLPYAVGRNKLRDFLRGARTEAMQPLSDLPLYGLFAAIDASYILAIIDSLLQEDILEQVDSSDWIDRPVLATSEGGRTALADDFPLSTGVSQLRSSDHQQRQDDRRAAHPNQGTKWTATEEAQLRALLDDGIAISEISRQLGRNRNAIERRIGKLRSQEHV